MILDTDILIDLKRQHPPAVAWWAALPALPSVCGIAAMELLHGSWDKKEQREVKTFLSSFPLLWPMPMDLVHAYTDYIPLKLSHGIGLLDALIAATAVGHGEPLATFNVKHFAAIPGLITIQPYMR